MMHNTTSAPRLFIDVDALASKAATVDGGQQCRKATQQSTDKPLTTTCGSHESHMLKTRGELHLTQPTTNWLKETGTVAEGPDPQQNCRAPRGRLEHQQDKGEVSQQRAGSSVGEKLQAVEHCKRPESAHQQEGVNPRLQSPARGGNAGHRATAWNPRR